MVVDSRSAAVDVVSVARRCYFYGMSIYRQLGVEPIINACGTVTRLGGAPMPPEVLDAYRAAASEAVSLEELQAAASVRIAAATKTEAGLVTSGAAGALTLGAAAILAGCDPARIEQLPTCDGIPNDFIIAREHRNGYDHAIRAAGARFVEVGFNEFGSGAGVRRVEAWEYEAATTSQTAGIVYVCSSDACPPLQEVVTVAHRSNLPVLVDAAAELPPRSNLQDIPTTGADLVAFSGGKAIRGPQSTGILCGRSDLVSAAALQMLDMDDHPELWSPPERFIDRSKLSGVPRHGIGRGLKVSKEEIAALLTALDLFTSGAYDSQFVDFRRWLEQIVAGLVESRSVCQIVEPSADGQWPVLEINVDCEVLGKSAFDVCRELRHRTPPVYVGHSGLRQGLLTINPVCLKEESVLDLIWAIQGALRG